jgi:hypothetical protein
MIGSSAGTRSLFARTARRVPLGDISKIDFIHALYECNRDFLNVIQGVSQSLS